MKRPIFSILSILFTVLAAQVAEADVPVSTNTVYITEVQSNPRGSGTDDAEWIEIHNTSTTGASIGGWQIQDYVGGSDPARISTTSWVFSSTLTLSGGEVIVVAKSATAFENIFGYLPSFELASASPNSTITPDLTSVNGSSVFALSNSSTGDAVVLKDATGTVMDAVEWGTLNRDVPGLPAGRPGDGDSLLRVALTGTSNADFIVATTPAPFIGYGANVPPIIRDIEIRPSVATFGSDFGVTATVTDMEGIAEASVYLTTATSSSGPALMPYQQISMTSTVANAYYFRGPLDNLASGLGFNEPQTFHEQYVRVFLYAEDVALAISTVPAEASELAENENYIWRNVVPAAPVTVEMARQQNTAGEMLYRNHAVWIKGRATSSPSTFRNDRINFTLQDGQSGIAVYATDISVPAFSEGDQIAVKGVLDQYYGLTQVSGRSLSVEVIEESNEKIEPARVTISELLANAEEYESRLILIEEVDFESPVSVWAGDGPGDGSNYVITDGTGNLSVRVWKDIDLVGTNTPSKKFAIRGVLSQRSTDGPNGLSAGYQLWPRGADDIILATVPQPDAGMPEDPDSGATTPGADAGTTTAEPDAGFQEAPRPGEPPVASDDCSCALSSPTQTKTPLFGIMLVVAVLWARRRKI
ncbi:MAG: lamin tail domain-containing protein [Myxococcota bacterium]|nr:lamin tail domain-containing protein [Myxococcota bacterium]